MLIDPNSAKATRFQVGTVGWARGCSDDLVGTELHRYHHSASLSESKNYAATLAILDVLFGTFYYLPGRVPERLGVFEPDAYPDSNEFWRVMKLPFVSTDPI